MPLPASERIAADLMRRIESGEYPPGTRLPSVPRLVEQYRDLGIRSEMPVRQALTILRARGIIELGVGRGNFVAHPGEPDHR